MAAADWNGMAKGLKVWLVEGEITGLDLPGGGAWKIAAVVYRFVQQVTTSLLRF
jgi:hypothetical protein